MKYGQVIQQEGALQRQSLLGPRLGQCPPLSCTNTDVQLDVDGDFSLDPSSTIKASLAGVNT